MDAHTEGPAGKRPAVPERYARQALFAPLGVRGQERLGAARVAVIGCGATGSAIATLLARAGAGFLRVVDRDLVEWSNLQRQILFDEADARDALPKAVAAERRLRASNADIEVEGVVADFGPATVDRLLAGINLVMDGTDNFETRYLLNDACVRDGRAWIYTGAMASYGMVMPVLPGRTACLRCVFPDPPGGGSATCDTAGVLGPAVTAAASAAAAEALKLLSGAETALLPGLLHLDVWDNEYEHVPARRRPDCPCCGGRDFPFLRAAVASQAAALCGRNAVQVTPAAPGEVSLAEIAARLQRLGETRLTPFLLRAWVDGRELTLFPDGRAIIHGTTDEGIARSIYARYIGS